MDFIGLLPEDEGYNCILSITDCLSADLRTIARQTDLTAEELAILFFDNWYFACGSFPHWGFDAPVYGLLLAEHAALSFLLQFNTHSILHTFFSPYLLSFFCQRGGHCKDACALTKSIPFR